MFDYPQRSATASTQTRVSRQIDAPQSESPPSLLPACPAYIDLDSLQCNCLFTSITSCGTHTVLHSLMNLWGSTALVYSFFLTPGHRNALASLRPSRIYGHPSATSVFTAILNAVLRSWPGYSSARNLYIAQTATRT